MSDFFSFITVLFGDAVIFIMLQLLILFIFIYAGTVGRRNREQALLHDGQTLSHFVLAYGVISAAVIQAISAADMLAGFKLIVTIADLLVVFYLCFSNAWFRRIVAEAITKKQ